jgi:UDP-N-acetylmuramoyl-L-alanyl-D-glutamate--2,6-diaminopimelate ligase
VSDTLRENTTMRLSELVRALPDVERTADADVEIQGLAYDSRQVGPGYLFVAIPGHHTDGHRYLGQAIARGAAAVLVQDRDAVAGLPVPALVHHDTRAGLAPLAAAFYGQPTLRLRTVGITGTDGKTTTTALASVALEAGGLRCGMLSTVDFKVAGEQWANSTRQSTPEAPEVQALLARSADAGCTHAVIEATSHALSRALNRLGGCAFDLAVFTNISHEHLDFHGSFAQYRRDKLRLFEMLGETPAGAPSHKRRKVAVVNANDPSHRMFLDAAPAQAERLTFAVDAPADLRASGVAASREGLRFQLSTPWGEREARLRLSGDFNVWNTLAALGVALAEGVGLDAALQALGRVPGVRGRMERVEQGQPFSVLVDYAHTPGAFEKLMRLMRPLTAGRLIAVFGSAGERDREKRAIQGEVAGRFCDLLVLTDEDPRFEDSLAIIAEIAEGAQRAGKQSGHGYLVCPDRAAAIRRAFEEAEAGDIVLLLGKGHEGCIFYGAEARPWDEAAAARQALTELGYRDAGDEHA